MAACGSRATDQQAAEDRVSRCVARDLEREPSAFENRLQALGWIDGRTVDLEIRWADGHSERYSEIAAEFVRQPVDVIVTPGNAAAVVKQATSTIPIVLSSASDPVASGLVASLARPGGNVTGLSLQANELVGKRIESCINWLRTYAGSRSSAMPAIPLRRWRWKGPRRPRALSALNNQIGSSNPQDIASA